MADGIHPGPKGLRGRMLELWRRAVRNAPERPSSPYRKPWRPPAPAPHPRGLVGWKAPALPAAPVMSEAAQNAEQRRSYYEMLKTRVRDGQEGAPSVMRGDFNRERD